MSKKHLETITCPDCGHTGDFPIWDSLNADLNPEAKDELISGKLTRYVCGNCGNANEVAYSLLYHDMTGKLMVYMTAGRDSSEIESMPLGKMEGYSFRTVESRNDLVEKIWIAGAGLDDRLVEVFKLLVRNQAGIAEEDVFLFGGVDKDDSLMFVIVKTEGNESLNVPRESFTETMAKLSAYVKFPDVKPGNWQRVDTAFAVKAFEEGGEG
ncbi:MAG: CpXC domain-containing protein [Luteolibacter sp.]